MLSLVGTGCDSGMNLSATILQVAGHSFASGLDHGWFQAKTRFYGRDFMGCDRDRMHGLLRQANTFFDRDWASDADDNGEPEDDHPNVCDRHF